MFCLQGSGFPQPENETDITQNFCINVSKAIETYFTEKDWNCIVLFARFKNAPWLGERFCNRTVDRLQKTASQRTDINATIYAKFCNGIAARGFSATLNGAGLKWVSDNYA